MSVPNRLRIKSLLIDGFRGYPHSTQFDLDCDSVIVFGPNGVGKSSILDAIEFALFGKVAHFRGEEFGPTMDELVNEQSYEGGARVELVLQDQATTYRILRKKQVGERTDDAQLWINGSVYDGSANHKIEEVLKLNLSSFYASVYLHQGLIHDLVFGSPEDRTRAIDSLLGILDLEMLIKSIPLNELSTDIHQLNDELRTIESRRLGAKEALETTLLELQERINTGKSSPVKSMIDLEERIVKATRKLEGIASAAGRSIQISRTQINSANISSQVKVLRKTYTNLLRDPISRVHELELAALDLDSALELLDTLAHQMEKVDSQRRKLLDYLGPTPDKSLRQLERTSAKVQSEVENASERLKLLSIGLHLVEQSKTSICPLCWSPINRGRFMKQAYTRLNNLKDKPRLKRLQARAVEVKRQITSYENASAKLSDLRRVTEEMVRRVNEVISIASKRRKKKFLSLKSGANMKQAMITLRRRLRAEQRTLKKQSESHRRHLNQMSLGFEKDIDMLDLQVRYLETKRKVADLEAELPHFEHESRVLRSQLRELETLHTSLSVLLEAMVSARRETAETLLTELQPQLNLIHSRIRPHSYYDRLFIELERGKGRPKKLEYSYGIKAESIRNGARTYVRTRFSNAQINTVGLAIFISLALAGLHRFGAIFLDEPDQGLDREHKENLADVLRDLQPHSQVVVCTQDEEFLRILMARLTPREGNPQVLYEFSDWTARDGPVFSIQTRTAPRLMATSAPGT